MELESVVRKIVRNILEEKYRSNSTPESPEFAQNEENANNKSIIVLLPGGRTQNRNLEEQILKSLSRFCLPVVCYCGGESPQKTITVPFKQIHVPDGNQDKIEEIAGQADILIAPSLSISDLVRISNLMDDNVLASMIITSIFLRKEIVILREVLLPVDNDRLLIPPEISNFLSKHFLQLKKFGIRVVRKNNLISLVDSIFFSDNVKRPLVHVGHVRDWAKAGYVEVDIPAASIITPYAKDEIRALGIKLVLRGERK